MSFLIESAGDISGWNTDVPRGIVTAECQQELPEIWNASKPLSLAT